MESIQLRSTSGRIIASPINTVGVIENIAPRVYTLSLDDKGNIFFDFGPDLFATPKVIMGETNRYKDHVLTAFNERVGESIGVIMTGLAGSGKSLLAEVLSNHCITELKMPVLFIDKKLPATFIKDCMRITGPCVVYFDELGKLYDHEEQGKLLNLFSDSEFKDSLYIVCDNEKSTLHRFFFDRPGRFLFHIDYDGLSEELVREFIDANKVTGVLRDYILEYVRHYRSKITFDILRTLVKFSKKFKEEYQYREFIKMLNVPHPPITAYKVVSITKGDETLDRYAYNMDYNKLSGVFKLIVYKDRYSKQFVITDAIVTSEFTSDNTGTHIVKCDEYEVVLHSSLTAPNEWKMKQEKEVLNTQEDEFKPRFGGIHGRRPPFDVIEDEPW